VCGRKMDGSNGYRDRRPGRVCKECRTWSEKAIIDAIRRWAEEHGGIPPTYKEWQRAGVDHPSASHVNRRIGWNEALLRAGFGLHHDRRPETQERIEEQLRTGVSTQALADALGCTPQNIHQRVRYRGMRVSELRNGKRATA
jgi:hypothetical protein